MFTILLQNFFPSGHEARLAILYILVFYFNFHPVVSSYPASMSMTSDFRETKGRTAKILQGLSNKSEL